MFPCVAEDESYAAATKEAAMKEAADRDRKRNTENAPSFLRCYLVFHGSIFLIGSLVHFLCQ